MRWVGGWVEKVEVADSHGAGPLSHNYPAKAVMWVREGKRSLQGASEAWQPFTAGSRPGGGEGHHNCMYITMTPLPAYHVQGP